ncbi:MAG: HD domain-containing protein [Planctomycetota bacterium]|nr:HD domain-containing protein [Planctomycetota bacterium]
MAARKRFSVMRDPVHGDVYLTHEELRVLDTPEMQRMRGIKQLGPAFLVFPGSLHTRFDHSIGTVHVAQKMIEAINLSFQLDPARGIAIGEEEARVIRMAGLLHDVTHIPFGHNIEDQDALFERHDSAYRYERMFTRDTPIGRVLDDLGLREEVFSVLTKPGTPGRRDVPPYWSQVLSGTIAADILDYLARDAYFTGLRLQVDERVHSYFKIDRTTGNLYIDLAKHDLLREDILSEIVRMLEARYFFSERVYYHHAKVAAGALVARAIDLLVREGALGEGDLYGTTDSSILDVLLRAGGKCAPATQATVRDLVERFQERRLFKRACVFPAYENAEVQAELVDRFFAAGGGEARALVEGRIEETVRFATGRDIKVIVYCPAREMQLKEARIHVRWPGVEGVHPLSDFADRVPRLGDLERSYRDLWKFYVLCDDPDRDVLLKVQEVAAAEFPGARNVYSIAPA